MATNGVWPRGAQGGLGITFAFSPRPTCLSSEMMTSLSHLGSAPALESCNPEGPQVKTRQRRVLNGKGTELTGKSTGQPSAGRVPPRASAAPSSQGPSCPEPFASLYSGRDLLLIPWRLLVGGLLER